MEDRLARATLVSAADLGDGVATVIPKSEIEAALASDGEPIQLVLDVAGISDGASRSVPVSWERFDLERLLEQATGDDVTLTFDRDALWQAATTDVEAHGMREAVVALAVAATAATGAAGQASAYPSSAFGDSSAAPAQVAGDIAPDDRAVPRPTPVATSAPDIAPDDRAVPRPTPIATSAPDIAPDDRAVPRPTPIATSAPDIAPDDRAVPRPTPIATSAPDIAPDDRAVPRPTPVAPVTPVAVSAPDIAPDDRAVPRPTPVAPPVTGSVSDGTSWAPGPAETAAIAGALALTIAGAFFLVGGRRVRPRPI
jgi:hypothetical protein